MAHQQLAEIEMAGSNQQRGRSGRGSGMSDKNRNYEP